MKSTFAPYQTSVTCVRIECENGLTVRLTAYPYDLTMSNSSVYKTDYGYQPTAFTASAAMSPSSLDLEGIVSVAGISHDALASGVFDDARVFIFRCDFTNPVEDYEPVGGGFFGKSSLEDSHYRIEGMSLVDVLGQVFGKFFTASCGRTYGDALCGISLAAMTVTGALTGVTSSYVFRDSSRGEAADWFAAGTIQFTSGNNVRLKPLEIKSYAADGTITLHEPTYYTPQVGDTFTMVRGCRKREADCVAQGNIINFFGFTRIPAGSTYAHIGAQS